MRCSVIRYQFDSMTYSREFYDADARLETDLRQLTQTNVAGICIEAIVIVHGGGSCGMDLDPVTNQRFTVDTLFHLIITRRPCHQQPSLQSVVLSALCFNYHPTAHAGRKERLKCAIYSSHHSDITASSM